MDEPAFAGCVIGCCLIGVIQGEQGDKKKKKKIRNDRIVAVQQDAHSWADIETVDDLGKEFCRELEQFFLNYHSLSGEQYKVLATKVPGQALRLVKSGLR
jgi:inorganic pyrophosphatase